jgi:hypothetical protein
MFGRLYLPFLVAILTWFPSAVPCLAQQSTPPSAGRSASEESWRKSMVRTRLPKLGCFHAVYPSTEWQEIPCVEAPAFPQGRSQGQPGPANVGNGTDFLAQVSGGLINTLDGSFPFAYSDVQNPGESDSMYGANAFSVQINSNTFPSGLCGATSYPSCRGWEQFVFSNFPGGQFPSGIFIQNWLLGKTQPCPASWTYSSSGGGCFHNSSMTSISPVAITDLSQVTLTGDAESVDNTDAVALAVTTGGYQIFAQEQDSVLNLSQNWSSAEFNVFGGSNRSEARFNPYTVVGPQMTVYITNGTVSCVGSGTGFTGESNNLNLVIPCIAGGTFGQSVEFFETNSSPPAETPPTVSTQSASTISSSSAVLNGTVNPNFSAPFYWFQYSTSSSSLNCTSPAAGLTQPQAGTSLQINLPAPFTETVTGLSSGTTYYYVGCALYSGGLVKGNVASFTTVQLVSDLMSTSTPSGSGCSAPSATTTFFSNESQALVWFLVNNANAGDLITAHWNNPAGSIFTTYSWSPPTSSGQWCFWDSILISGNLPASEPGTWNVYVSYNGSFLFSQSFTIQHAPPGLQFYPVTPCRLVDTRGAAGGFNGIAPFSGPSIPSKGTITIPVQSAAEASANTMPAPCGVIPSTAQAYSFNLTVVPAAGGAVDYVSLWPAGSAQPFVSTLDDPQGLIVSNAAIVPAGAPSGGISVYNAGPSATDIVIDMNGYFAPPGTGGLEFYPVAPCRLVDTRGAAAGFNGIAPFSGPPVPPVGTATIPVQSATEASIDTEPAPCGVIPSGAEAYSFNLTVVPMVAGSQVDYVSMWPAGSAQPFVSTLDDPQGLIVSNAAIVRAGTPSGGVSVYNQGPAATDVILDMNGYFAAPAGLQFYPVTPCRLVDTRGAAAGFNGIEPFSGPSIPGSGTITIPVQSATEASTDTEPAPCGVIPSSAQAYSINLTVVPSGSRVDYVSLWPSGSAQPVVSTLDDPQGLIVSNAAIVPAGSPSGGISVYNAGPATTDVVIDLNGYFAP